MPLLDWAWAAPNVQFPVEGSQNFGRGEGEDGVAVLPVLIGASIVAYVPSGDQDAPAGEQHSAVPHPRRCHGACGCPGVGLGTVQLTGIDGVVSIVGGAAPDGQHAAIRHRDQQVLAAGGGHVASA